MSKNTTSKLWFIAAIGFMISGILDKNIAFMVLGCSFTIFGCQHMKPKNENRDNDNDETKL